MRAMARGLIGLALWFSVAVAVGDDEVSELVLRVAVEHAAANDSGPGTPEQPLGSLAEAARRAVPVLARGGSVTVELEAGVYRGGAEFVVDGDRRQGTLRICSVGESEVIIRGSRIVGGWNAEGEYFARDLDWLKPTKLEATVLDEPLILFVHDVRVTRVEDLALVRLGKFAVDRERGRIVMLPPKNAPVLANNVELAIPLGRPLLRVAGVEQLELEGITVERLGGGRGSPAAVEVRNAGRVDVGDVRMQWNGWGGGVFEDIDQLNMLRVKADHNGGFGLLLRTIGELRSVACSAVLNNWRGAEAGGWADESVFGVRAETVGKALFARWRVVDNHADGLVVDSGLGDIAVERSTAAGNRGDGMRVTARTFYGDEVRALVNDGSGVVLLVLVAVDWKYGLIFGNRGAAMECGGSGATVWKVTHSVIVGGDGPAVKAIAINAAYWDGARNLFYRLDGSDEAFDLNGSLMTLRQWRQVTGSDTLSRFADPLLDRAGDFNFSFSPDSPWRHHLEWQPE